MGKEAELAKVWVSKYALTKGVLQRKAEIYSDGMCKPVNMAYLFKGAWHRNEQEAIAKAEEMRNKKIASLKKQIEKLKNMRFE